jgi:hypothetical protein
LRKSRYSDDQIAAALRQVEAGTPIADITVGAAVEGSVGELGGDGVPGGGAGELGGSLVGSGGAGPAATYCEHASIEFRPFKQAAI